MTISIMNLAEYADGILTIPLAPPTAIGGWSLEFTQTRRFGGTPIFTLYCASGYNGVSGLTVINSGQGIIQANISPFPVSGFTAGVYTFTLKRTDSGSRTVLATGQRLMLGY